MGSTAADFDQDKDGNLLLPRNPNSVLARLNVADRRWLEEQIDGARTEAEVVDERRLEMGITYWEMEQLMRQDILNAYQNGNIADLDLPQYFDQPSVKVGIIQSYTELAHRTWNEERQEFDIHPWYDLYPLWERAREWVEKRLEDADWRVGECDAGKRRRFISDNLFGLECAVSQIGWTIRYDTRMMKPEIMDYQGEYMEINDLWICTVFVRTNGACGNRGNGRGLDGKIGGEWGSGRGCMHDICARGNLKSGTPGGLGKSGPIKASFLSARKCRFSSV